jgi:hypothetical protein
MKTQMTPFLPRRLAPLVAAMAALLLAPPAVPAPDPASPQLAGKTRPVTLEPIAGTSAKRVILTPKAAERLGIETGLVGEQQIVLKQMVSGLVTLGADKPPAGKPGGGGAFGGFAPPVGTGAGRAVMAPVASRAADVQVDGAGASSPPMAMKVPAQPTPSTPSTSSTGAPVLGDAWVQVNLSPAEWERLAKDKPARLLPLVPGDKPAETALLAQPSGQPPVEDPKRTMLSVYYIVPGKDHGLTLNSRLRVELQVAGTQDKRKVVPYSALYYDGKGAPWVYVNTSPLTFERRPVTVERVVGDSAILSDGPADGTAAVTVGAAMLYGTEMYGK